MSIEVIVSSRGKKTIATNSFKKGNKVLLIEGVETAIRDKFTIQISKEKHIFPNENSGKYINHSCSPNLKKDENFVFIAYRDILKGDEITFDYETTEDEIAEAFVCLCGSENCRGIVGKGEI